MGLHPSLKRSDVKGNRSVMKRTERIKWLIGKGKWNEGDPVLGLPKIKIIKLKAIKKEKQKPEEEGQPTEGAKKPVEKKSKD
ncbi:MAG: small basic protein [Candidatus Omnitrophica bacterium]|nr:small basic protein [Candidatus Omnitrophota bacterium]